MYIKYSADKKYAYFNGYKFTKDNKTNYYLSSTINGKRYRLHRYIWEWYNGTIPKGYDIHHKDHNKFNNEIDNLELLSKANHLKRHIEEMTEETKQKNRLGALGKKCIHNEFETKYIKSEELDFYLNNGWKIGKHKKDCNFGRKAWNAGLKIGNFTEEHKKRISESLKKYIIIIISKKIAPKRDCPFLVQFFNKLPKAIPLSAIGLSRTPTPTIQDNKTGKSNLVGNFNIPLTAKARCLCKVN